MSRRPNTPIDVCSHKRSGTHFLMATLWLNFDMGDVSIIAPIHAGKKFKRLDGHIAVPGERLNIPWGGLWLTHGGFKCSYDPGRTIFVVRNPVDTLMSLWRFNDPMMERSPENSIGRRAVIHWYKLARGYLVSGCTVIRYEDLVGDARADTLAMIEIQHGLVRKHADFIRLDAHVGWYSFLSPQQPAKPPTSLIDAVSEIVPTGFLGY